MNPNVAWFQTGKLGKLWEGCVMSKVNLGQKSIKELHNAGMNSINNQWDFAKDHEKVDNGKKVSLLLKIFFLSCI